MQSWTNSTWPSQPEATFSVLRCRKTLSYKRTTRKTKSRSFIMTSTFFNRRKLMTSLAAVMSAVGAGTLMATSAQAKSRDAGVRKLGRDGKPADGKQMITRADYAQWPALHCRAGRQLERAGRQRSGISQERADPPRSTGCAHPLPRGARVPVNLILRPVTLTLRLLMNMVAGHMLLLLCFGATESSLITVLAHQGNPIWIARRRNVRLRNRLHRAGALCRCAPGIRHHHPRGHLHPDGAGR